MKWKKDALAEVGKVPFFVRKRVKKRVEAHVENKGTNVVTLTDVQELKNRFLSKGGMEKEIKGYEVSTCFGNAGCPNQAFPTADLVSDIENILLKADILKFLKQSVKGDLKFHHEFRVALADCANACSRPQIVDIGIIGVSVPGLTDALCSQCENCVNACKEGAIQFEPGSQVPRIDAATCLLCKKCVIECPTGSLKEEKAGFKVLLGGRLGRHPRLGLAVPGLKTHDDVLKIVQNSISFYKNHSKNGQRFSHLLKSVDQVLE